MYMHTAVLLAAETYASNMCCTRKIDACLYAPHDVVRTRGKKDTLECAAATLNIIPHLGSLLKYISHTITLPSKPFRYFASSSPLKRQTPVYI